MGGVAGGLAEYFNVDPVIIRVIFIVSVFAWGLSVLVYILLWILLPVKETPEFIKDETNYDPEVSKIYEEMGGTKPVNEKKDRKVIAGVLLIVFGLLILIDRVTDIEIFHIWPLILVGFGAYIIYRSYNSSKNL